MGHQDGGECLRGGLPTIDIIEMERSHTFRPLRNGGQRCRHRWSQWVRIAGDALVVVYKEAPPGCLWLRDHLKASRSTGPCDNFYEHVCGKRNGSLLLDAQRKLESAVATSLLATSENEPQPNASLFLERCLHRETVSRTVRQKRYKMTEGQLRGGASLVPPSGRASCI